MSEAVQFVSPQPVTFDPNTQVVHSNATVSASGSTTTQAVLGTAQVELIINITGTPTGTLPTLQFSIVEVDPVDLTTSVGTPVNSNTFNAVGYQIVELAATKSSAFKVSWTLGGTGGPEFTGVNVSVSGKSAAAGSAASNASVGTLAATAPTSGTQIAGVNIDGNLTAITVSRSGHVAVAGNSLQGYAGEVIGWATNTHQELTADGSGALYTRGQVMTDEGSFIDDFPGSGFTTNLTGTLDFTNNSDQVVGTGTKFLSELDYYTVIKKSTDGDTLYLQVSSVEDDTHLTLLSAYQGTTQTGQTGVKSKWITAVGTGASLTVGSSLVTIAAGTTSGSLTGFWTVPDYIPFLGALKVAVDTRRANQNIYLGWFDVAQNAQPNLVAAFLLDGTTNTTVKCVSGTSTAAADTQTTSITIPNAANSGASNVYRIAPWQGQVAFYINDTLVAVNTQHIVPPYADLRLGVYVVNTGVPAGATGIVTDSIIYESIDRFDVRCYNTNADLLQTTSNGRTTTGVPVPIQVSAAGIQVISGAVTLTSTTLSGTTNTIRGNVTQYTADGTAAVANSLPVIAQMLATKQGANTLDRLLAAPNSNDGVGSTAVGVLQVNSHLLGWNGGSYDRLRSTIANGLAVDVTRVTGTVTVGGINATAGGITGNPVRIGASDGTNTRDIQSDTSGNLKFVGIGTAGTPAGGVLTVQGSPSGTPMPVSGTVTAANASVSATGATPPASATYMGGSVTTAAPTYTTGQMNALSLTTGGRLRVEPEFLNVVDAGNSTTTPLGANATFTGTAVDLLGYASVTYSVFASHDSATNGVICQFSPDNVNWDDRVVNEKDADGTASDLSIRCHDRYFRIKYTNGATPQTTFRLQTILKRYMPAGDTCGVDHPPFSGDDALLVKAVITGKTAGGVFVDVRTSATGKLQFGGGSTATDNYANPTDAQDNVSLNMAWNTATSSWDRIRSFGTNSDAEAVTTIGALNVCAHPRMFNGTDWDRQRGTIANGLLVDVSRVQGSVAVTGTFWQATQPVSGTVTAAQATAANLNATVVQGNAGTAAQGWFVRVADASGNLQPTGDTAGRSRFNRITDGTNTAAVKAASTAAAAADPSLVVTLSPNSSGTVAQGTGLLGAAQASAWLTKITDGTNGLVTVKAASTAAVAGDQALVVAISPNNTVPVTANAPSSSTSSVTNVSAAAASTQILAANAARMCATVYNDSSSVCYLKLGSGASATSMTLPMQPYSYYDVPEVWRGAVFGYWVTATGAARVTELTA
jgi:hypothetical protein